MHWVQASTFVYKKRITKSNVKPLTRFLLLKRAAKIVFNFLNRETKLRLKSDGILYLGRLAIP